MIADFGCGAAELSRSVEQKVHSFDLIATNDSVTACDMAHVPLDDSSVNVAVFCLSLMGTNLQDYLVEANRVLKIGYDQCKLLIPVCYIIYIYIYFYF